MFLINDTTLRDGEQAPYVAFNTKEKLDIAQKLYEAGADELEVGIPAMGKKEQEDLKEILALNLPIPIMSWNRATMSDLEASLECGLKSVDLSIPVSDILIDVKFGGDKQKVLSQLEKVILHAKKEGLFVLEGQRELELALKGGYEIQTLFFYASSISEKDILSTLSTLKFQPQLISVSRDVYEKIAYRETTEGVLAIVKSKSHQLDELQFKTDNPLILVAEAPEKPGNIGALLRTADAANLDAVIIANPKGDIYNPNIIRSSIGCVFTNQIATGSTSEVIAFLKGATIDLYCAALSASENYTKVDFLKGSAIVVGTESTGLTNEWLDNSTQNIVIPMSGEIDSMNVSVSAAILIFEAMRQRGF